MEPNGLNILLVDDRPEDIMALEAELAPLGYNLVSVNSGEAALREILLRDFAVIILDVVMPKMDGYETANMIKARAKSRNVPIIFVTASGEEPIKGYAIGAVDYIPKPFNPEILKAKVRVFAELYKARQDLAEEITASEEIGKLLWESEERLRAITSSVNDGIIALDGAGKISFWNRAAEKIFDFSFEEVLGKDISGLIVPEEYRELHNKGMAAFMKTGQGRLVGNRVEVLGLKKDGREFPLEISVSAIKREVDVSAIGVIRDITDRKNAEKKMRLAAKVFENSSEGIVVTTAEGIIESVNPAMTRLTGYDPSELIGNNPRMLKSGRHEAVFYEEMWRGLSESGQWKGDIWNKNKEGEITPFEISINTIKDGTGKTVQYVAIYNDIRERKLAEDALRFQSLNDALTGVANRRGFDETLRREWSRALRGPYPVSLVMLDIDYFKSYNDTYGHQAGDRILRTVGAILKSAMKRPADMVARYGGEEFAIILPMADAEHARIVAERIRVEVESLKIPHEGSKKGGLLTISAGAAGASPLPERDTTPQTLIESADKALYEAKRRGRNCVVSTTP